MATKISYVPTNAEPRDQGPPMSSADRWRDVEGQLRWYKDTWRPDGDNGWGDGTGNGGNNANYKNPQQPNPFNFSDVNQATANQMSQLMGQIGQMNAQQTNQNKSNLLQMAQQAAAQQQSTEAVRGQNELANQLAMYQAQQGGDPFGGTARQNQIDDRVNAQNFSMMQQSANTAANEYQQAQMLNAQRAENSKQRASEEAQAKIAAKAQTDTARIGAEAGVLSSIFSNFGMGGSGFRYW